MPFYQVTLPGDIRAALDVSKDGVVTEANPVLKQSVGLRIDKVRQWAEKKGGKVRMVSGLPASIVPVLAKRPDAGKR